jgi:hypothetical protein
MLLIANDPIENLINDQFIVFCLFFIFLIKKIIYKNGMETEGVNELLEYRKQNAPHNNGCSSAHKPNFFCSIINSMTLTANASK